MDTDVTSGQDARPPLSPDALAVVAELRLKGPMRFTDLMSSLAWTTVRTMRAVNEAYDRGATEIIDGGQKIKAVDE